jgi:hypothetical protein
MDGTWISNLQLLTLFNIYIFSRIKENTAKPEALCTAVSCIYIYTYVGSVVSYETQCYWAQMDRSAIALVVLLLLGAFLRESYAVSYSEVLQSGFKSFRILEFYCTPFKVTSVAFFFTGATTHCGFVFCSPLAGYSLLAYEVSWSHTTTRHSR